MKHRISTRKPNRPLQEELYDLLEGSWLDGERYFSSDCPIDGREHDSPPFLVYEDGYYCMSCEANGSLEYLKTQIGTFKPRSFVKSKFQILPKWKKWQEKYDDLQGIAEFGHKNLLQFKNLQGFIKHRKLEDYVKQGMFGHIDGWHLFPVFDKDKTIVDIVVRAGQGKGNASKYILSSIAEREHPYIYVPNWKRVASANHIYVVFGMIDVWALEMLGLAGITGTSGKSLQAELLDEFQVPITIIPDQDEEASAWRLAGGLGWRGSVKYIDWLDDTKDLDDIRRKYGLEKLKEML